MAQLMAILLQCFEIQIQNCDPKLGWIKESWCVWICLDLIERSSIGVKRTWVSLAYSWRHLEMVHPTTLIFSETGLSAGGAGWTGEWGILLENLHATICEHRQRCHDVDFHITGCDLSPATWVCTEVSSTFCLWTMWGYWTDFKISLCTYGANLQETLMSQNSPSASWKLRDV